MSLPNLAGVIPNFGTGTYAVTRRAAASYDSDGKVVLPAPTVVNVDASIHRVAGRDLQRLPEGVRAEETIKIFTTVPLYTKDAAHEPDVVNAHGYDWEVVTVDGWGDLGAGYWRSFASKVQP